MSEKELFNKKVFIELFNMSEIERIEREDELFIQAKKLGMEKRFKESLKKYAGILKDKMIIGENLDLPKCNYDISFYDTGKYIIKTDGIIDSKTDYKFSYFPILPVERYINQETGKEKVKIIYFKENKWKELIVDKSQLSISQKLLLLSDDGIDVNSNNVKFYIDYFNTMLNINNVKKLKSVSHIGWKDNDFIPYDTHGIFDGADEFRNIYGAIGSKGNYEKWKNTVFELRKNKIIKILMAVTLASPLLEKLNLQPYMVNLWSSLSGNGKTLSCMVAMSIWGNPSIGALRLSSNNTQNYYITIASFMRNFTCYFDELQIIKNSKYLDTESLIMDLCNGTEKGRLSKNSQLKEVKTWYNNFLFTSNDKLVKENAGEQVYNRVIDIEIHEKLIDKDGPNIAKIITENYGFAGKEYMKHIKEIGIDKIFDRHKEITKKILEETPSTDKQASSLASILLANELANECIFNDDYILQVEDIKEYVNDKNEIKTSIKSKEYIKNIIEINGKRFEEANFGEWWGRIKDYNGINYCYINIEVLTRELKKGGFEFESVKKEWAEMEFLRRSTTGRYVHQTTVFKEKGNYVILNLGN